MIEWCGFKWTAISENLILCDSCIATMPFRLDYQAENANNYEKSDVKKWLGKWFDECKRSSKRLEKLLWEEKVENGC